MLKANFARFRLLDISEEVRVDGDEVKGWEGESVGGNESGRMRQW